MANDNINLIEKWTPGQRFTAQQIEFMIMPEACPYCDSAEIRMDLFTGKWSCTNGHRNFAVCCEGCSGVGQVAVMREFRPIIGKALYLEGEVCRKCKGAGYLMLTVGGAH